MKSESIIVDVDNIIRDIPEYPNYAACRDGDIINLYTGNTLKPYLHLGYPTLRLPLSNGRYKAIKVHRLVASAWFGPANGKEVNHKNGIKADNRVENLEYCTKKENLQHAWRIGLNKMTDERKKRLSEINKATAKRGGESKSAKKVIDTSTGIIYGTLTEAAESFGMKIGTLGMMLKGNRKNKTTLKYYDQPK